jgi:hypothetical protein
MSNYRKTMTKALQEMYSLDESVIDKVKEIASKKSAKKIDGVMVDSFTASAISQIYDKVNDANKKKMEKLPITKLADLAFKMMQKNEFVPEEVELDEVSPNKQKSDVIVMKKGNVEKSVVGASGVKKAEKEGYKIQYALLAPNGKKVTSPKDIMKAIKSADKLGIGEEVELDEASARADARRSMRADPDMRQMFSKDVSATDDDVKGASKNIMMQMRKAQSLKGRFDVEFGDGKKVRIPAKVAIAVQQKFNSMRRPAEKEKFQSKVAKSYKDMLRALKEEVELDEAKYEIYHKDFSSAMQHAYKMAKKLHGITIDPKEIDDKVATGPRKPSSGKTNSYRLKGDRGSIQVQVANLDNKRYELNMYKEEVELDEDVKFDNADFMLGFLYHWSRNPTTKYEPHLANYVKKLIPAKNRQYAYTMIAQQIVKLIRGGMPAVNNYARQTKSIYDKMDSKVKKHLMKGMKEDLDEASVTVDLENDDPKLLKDIKRMGLKIKDNGDSGNPGYNEYTITGSDSKLKAGGKKFGWDQQVENAKLDERSRQLKDPKKEMMVSKGGKVQVINKKDWPKYEKKGYIQAEEVELDEGGAKRQLMKVSDLITTLINKGGIDKSDYETAQGHVEDGDMKGLATTVKRLDTEPKEAIINAVAKGMGKKEAEKIFKVKILRVEEADLDEGKMQDVWQKRNAKSLSVGPFELLRGKPGGVHTIKRSGKVIGDFSLDTDADLFVANIKGQRAQWVGNDIDSLFTHLQKTHKESLLDKINAKIQEKKNG